MRRTSPAHSFPEVRLTGLPLLCPARPRDILELDFLEAKFHARERGLVFGNPASLDRPQSSRRRCELGRDGLVGDPRRRMRRCCDKSPFVSVSGEGDARAAAQCHEVRTLTEFHRRARRNDHAERVPPFNRHFRPSGTVTRRDQEAPWTRGGHGSLGPLGCDGRLPLPFGRCGGEALRQAPLLAEKRLTLLVENIGAAPGDVEAAE